MRTLAERLRHELRAVACDVLRYDQDTDALEQVAVAAAEGAPPLRGLLCASADFGEAAAALVSGEAVTIHDLSAEKLSGPHLARRDQSGARSVHVAPIHLGDRVVGLIAVYSDAPERVSTGTSLRSSRPPRPRRRLPWVARATPECLPAASPSSMTSSPDSASARLRWTPNPLHSRRCRRCERTRRFRRLHAVSRG